MVFHPWSAPSLASKYSPITSDVGVTDYEPVSHSGEK
jgi:hypothetical protein